MSGVSDSADADAPSPMSDVSSASDSSPASDSSVTSDSPVASDSSAASTTPASLGRELARTLVAEHGTRDPRRLAELETVRVERERWTGLDGVTVLGTYRDDEITLYPRQIDEAARNHSVSRSELTTAVVAHELGHHLLRDRDLLPEGSESVWRRFVRFVGGSETASRREFEERAAEQFTTSLLRIELPESLRHGTETRTV